MNIGATIREIRQRKGITIAQLCEGTGLSKGFMSQVENNKASPSIETLATIAKFLNVPLPYLLLEKENRMKVVRHNERERSIYGKDGLVIEHVAEEGGLRLSLVEIPVGFPKENEPNAHEGEECHLVLRGKLEVQHGEDVAVVEEGDSFSWCACVPHIVRNIGDESALLLISNYIENRRRIY
ncbi:MULTISPECIES: helix-turn-helix domain-containing protein [Aneurinibacillus]|jgi:transcriptional regulator with XRE-family HTH domain|uniref:Transcriptional regulator, contains XRE-family HTH domain n=1 Tax=Aneurinibacillus thermoaerophilus TaxID=143495 RepID=A0A1G7YNY6_ANETH|nr:MULTISPECIES: XRE family transcriptional regulator [Aneurinibacillus]AMA73785.1 DNA-binding protein [Aneurinibacillus sp. XH2]MED0677142.1 XRE family transcriptional regulator [Aneurinibacillus thermoaerophilus]MED0679398.1 XRE family transcriptional regulator [Aneurinibacillus thermoaerophilus]MED0738031.1 XRE family transcriptional regulator [Aneurinibacillus thermoaerophilus]MED0756452.1 XRE family transcriptional regulator [Aneurinibacillus thermoaerophilus]